jgi:hypothetical protein
MDILQILFSFSKIAKAGAFSDISDESGKIFTKSIELFKKAVIDFKGVLASLMDMDDCLDLAILGIVRLLDGLFIIIIFYYFFRWNILWKE